MNTANYKLILIGLLIASLLGYLEWSKFNNTFLFEAEYLIISKLFSNPVSVVHPLTIIPMVGQILLIISLFQKQPKAKLVFSAIASIGILYLLILFVGILSKNFKIVVSTTPFLILSFFAIKYTLSNKSKK
ncbi:MAG: hypothetical protein IT243_04625 [Bacteroidia bacterium]|nr:hypothetical protein [Bacteroidia bacterium]